MPHDKPCLVEHVGIGVGEHLDEPVRHRESLFVFLHAIEVIGGCSEDDGGFIVLREGVGKLQ